MEKWRSKTKNLNKVGTRGVHPNTAQTKKTTKRHGKHIYDSAVLFATKNDPRAKPNRTHKTQCHFEVMLLFGYSPRVRSFGGWVFFLCVTGDREGRPSNVICVDVPPRADGTQLLLWFFFFFAHCDVDAGVTGVFLDVTHRLSIVWYYRRGDRSALILICWHSFRVPPSALLGQPLTRAHN